MEDKLSLSVSRVPARRFFYYKFNGLPLDWNEGLSIVNKLIESIPTLNFAHSSIILWLNGQNYDDHKEDLICKVGREVIGHYELDCDQGEDTGIIDGVARECYRFNLGEVPPESITFEKFFDLERELRKKTADFGTVEDAWRIVINYGPSDKKNPVVINAEIQFFSKL